jgi:lipoic acid synthetase
MQGTTVNQQKPDWLRTRAPSGAAYERVRETARRDGVRTVCDASHCPNLGECWSHGNATFMILGDSCTRACRFCAVHHGVPSAIDPAEPRRVAAAVERLGLRHVVVTSVTRDDLPDQGAEQFAQTVREIRAASPAAKVELLVPDLQGNEDALRTVVDAGPDVIAHNLEVVRRLQPEVRDAMASYDRSLDVLARYGRLSEAYTKSSLMLGVGEEREEVLAAMRDLRQAGVDILTIGQYLQPRGCELPVIRYVPPSEFDELRQEALALGFARVASGPLVRSSYRAFETFNVTQEGST